MKTLRTITVQPLDWHRNCLTNLKHTLVLYEERLAHAQFSVNKVRKDIAFYTHQIEEAQRQGKDTFDRDRFLVPRRKKG